MRRPGERGATAAEYAIIVGMVATVIVTSVTFFGAQVASLFVPVADFFASHH